MAGTSDVRRGAPLRGNLFWTPTLDFFGRDMKKTNVKNTVCWSPAHNVDLIFSGGPWAPWAPEAAGRRPTLGPEAPKEGPGGHGRGIGTGILDWDSGAWTGGRVSGLKSHHILTLKLLACTRQSNSSRASANGRRESRLMSRSVAQWQPRLKDTRPRIG